MSFSLFPDYGLNRGPISGRFFAVIHFPVLFLYPSLSLNFFRFCSFPFLFFYMPFSHHSLLSFLSLSAYQSLHTEMDYLSSAVGWVTKMTGLNKRKTSLKHWLMGATDTLWTELEKQRGEGQWLVLTNLTSRAGHLGAQGSSSLQDSGSTLVPVPASRLASCSTSSYFSTPSWSPGLLPQSPHLSTTHKWISMLLLLRWEV